MEREKGKKGAGCVMALLKADPIGSFSVVSLLLSFLAYGLFFQELGIYGDDPNFLWAYHRGGAAEYEFFMKWIRDIGYLVYQFLSPIFQESASAWRLFAFSLRWMSAVLCYAALVNSFPALKRFCAWIALCLLLYPGFTQQSIGVEFSLHFLSSALIFLSFRLTQRAILQPRLRALFAILSAMTQLIGLFIIEYFMGWEVFRPILIWALFSNRLKEKKPIRKTLLWSVPYALIWVIFGIWRAFFSVSSYMKPSVLSRIGADSGKFLTEIIAAIGKDFRVANIDAWLKAFSMPDGGKSLFLYFAVFAISFAACILLTRILPQDAPEKSGDRSRLLWVVIGVLLFLCGGIPVWAAGLHMDLELFWNRLTLCFMLGASILFVAFFSLIIRKKYLPILFSLFTALLVCRQLQVQNQFRKEWMIVKNYYWQLYQRAPDILENTLLLADQLPFSTMTDNSLNALLNWNYERPELPAAEPLGYFHISAREGFLRDFAPDIPISHDEFRGNTSDSLVIFATPGTCLRVLTLSDRNLPFLNSALKKSIPLSNLRRIIRFPQRTVRFQSFMGDEPQNWCASFEKAELAAQHEDWAEALRLGKEAFARGWKPLSFSEMDVFIAAALMEDDFECADSWIALIQSEEGLEQYHYDKFSWMASTLALSPEGLRMATSARDWMSQAWQGSNP